MTDRTPAEIAEALDLQDGWTLFAQWADNITPEEAHKKWQALSPNDRGEWHRRALPFTQLGSAAAAKLRAMELALMPFAEVARWFDHPNSPGVPFEEDAEGVTMGLTVGRFRAARSALARGED